MSGDLSERTWSSEDIAKLKNCFTDGIQTLQEIDDLQDHMKELCKSVADELDIPVSIIKTAIKTVHKGVHQNTKDRINAIEELCNTVGRPIS